jgi:hypothetical protein
MKSITFNGQTVVAVHILNTVIDGNHVPFSEKRTITLFTKNAEPFRISEEEYEAHIVGSGIPKYTGTLEKGGGRHQFYGWDVNDVEEGLAETLLYKVM